MGKITINREFEQVAILIEEARSRAFSKVNAELVLLYFNVGKIVSVKVVEGIWGENTVGELAIFIQDKFPGFSGFTRRGLYRMKQFYEVYSSAEFISPITAQLEAYFAEKKENEKVSAVPTQTAQFKALQEQFIALYRTAIKVGISPEGLNMNSPGFFTRGKSTC